MSELYRAVLNRAMRDAFPVRISELTRPYMLAAIAWLGEYPSKDFRQVCDFAGIEPMRLHSVILSKMKMTKEEREEFGKQIRHFE